MGPVWAGGGVRSVADTTSRGYTAVSTDGNSAILHR